MNDPASSLQLADCQLLTKLIASHAVLKEENQSLKHQLAWFKKQLFGTRPEKRLVDDNPAQLDIEGILADKPELPPPPETENIIYTRRKKDRSDNCVTDQGLRFSSDVPVEVIEQRAPELQGDDADQYEIIDYKVTRRLAQRPGSYVVLEYRRPLLRHKPTKTLSSIPAPTGLFDRSFADVSLLVGILIDKFVHHLPLHRQHHRMIMSGITILALMGIRAICPYQLIGLLQPCRLSGFRSPVFTC